MNLLLGIIIFALGVTIIRYRYEIHRITGNWGWAEQYTAGTVNAIVLTGMLLIGVGTAYPLGAFEGGVGPSTGAITTPQK